MFLNKRAGTTLIELLVVIVVFLVGILAIVQVFPPGINILRTTARNTIASQLGAAEMQRIQGQPGSTAEMIVPVSYQSTASGVRVTIDTNRLTGDLMPPRDPGLPGRVDKDGIVKISGVSVGKWQTTSGSNLFSRVIGESKPVPGPRRIPGLPPGQDFGGVYTMTFAPAYYFPTPQGIGEDGVVQAYGNDMVRRYGNRDFNSPNPNGRFREGEFFFVASEDTDDTNFQNEDQIWVAQSKLRKYRIAFSFAYSSNTRTEQFDLIVQANLDPLNPPSYAKVVGNYWVISLPELVSLPDIYGNPSQFTKANYQFAEPDSVRLQRVFQEIPITQAFDSSDPYQYKVVGSAVTTDPSGKIPARGFCLGTLLFNPSGFNFRVRSSTGPNEVLQARVDYTVYDWRLIKDEFRVPTAENVGGSLLPKELKLSLGGIRALNTGEADNLGFRGTGLNTPTLTALGSLAWTPDVVMLDLETGGVILGNTPNLPAAPNQSAWNVEKNTGHVTFYDADGIPGNGLSAYVCFPSATGFSAPQLVPDISNKSVRVMYMAKNEWSVQPFKAARTYRVAGFIGANGLGPGECFVGGTLDSLGQPIGKQYRIYVAPYDLGQKIIAGEIWTSDGSGPTAIYDQELQIVGIENVNGIDLAYADIHDKTPATALFDWSQGYAVRRVRGASMKVRVMWNPTSFQLGSDEIKNYNELEVWMRNWRKTENESLQIGGRN